MIFRRVGVGRVGVCIMCVCDSEEREGWVGATILSETLKVVGVDGTGRAFGGKKKP